MIIVILGGRESDSDKVISQLMRSKISRIRHLNIQGVAMCSGVGLLRLKAEFDQPNKLTNLVTIVSGVSTNTELEYLRKMDAFICHCYGKLTKLYNEVSILPTDKFVLPDPLSSKAPEHIYTPDEVLSECYIRG